MKLIFIGTPEFAVPPLNRLAQAHEIVCVVTQPDKPQGRGMKVSPPPVKFVGSQLGIPVLQPEKISTVTDDLKKYAPDLIVVVASGHILTKEILAIPEKGCVNLHASLLPEFRGPEPIAWSIIKGLKKTGLTTMWMDEGIDTGDIIQQKEVEINPEDTKGSLEQKLSQLGSELLFETLKMIEAGAVTGRKQGNNFSFAPIIKKQDCKIDWKMTAREIHDFIRGLNPEPSAFAFLDGKRLKIFRSSVGPGLPAHVSAGEIIDAKPDEICVSTGRGVLSLLEVQPEGKRAMTAKEYLAGHPPHKGTRLI